METPFQGQGSQTSNDDAANNSKKEWYKKWWVILIGIVIALPFFWVVVPAVLLWFIWKKPNNLSRRTKGVLSTVLAVFILIALANIGDNNRQDSGTKKQEIATNQPKEQPAVEPVQDDAPAQQTEVKQAPQFVFDIPALVGKNLDEIKAALGAPKTAKEPTKQQLAVVDTWEIEYEKDGAGLLVSYNPKTKAVVEFFMDGEDKAKLLAQGNLQEKNDAYVVDPVKNILDSNKITGIKIMKKLPQELDANVTYSAVAIKIENKEDYGWTDCKLELNGGGKLFSSGYEYKVPAGGIKAKGEVTVSFSEFTKDSQRFNYFLEKPENFFISCNTGSQHRTSYLSVN